ncbi:MAG: ATP-binding cassette domain-containing protein [Planctomycetales bacterium]|nr:ATP-binding cassette domain-containing protein [Planctomycetales bacterium]
MTSAVPTQGDRLSGRPAATAPPIQVRNLTVAYEGRAVLRSVSFALSPHALTGIIGPNGAGKSTLLRAILGLLPLDGGKVEIFGRPVEQVRDRLAYVPQKQTIDWDFPVTVLDVVLMGRYGQLGLFGRPGRVDRELALEALEKVGMGSFTRRHIRQLSGGQQQRVFLARALCQQADILLLDEPFGGVDAATESAIFKLIDELTQSGKTLLVVNHDLSILDRFAAVLLLNQRVIAFGPTAETATNEKLRQTYGGRLSLLERADERLQDMRP